jgi:hypothetical protein
VITRPLTPAKLRAWVKYHATKGAYCPAGCGKKFANDEQWVWQLSRSIYFICRECALGRMVAATLLSPLTCRLSWKPTNGIRAATGWRWCSECAGDRPSGTPRTALFPLLQTAIGIGRPSLPCMRSEQRRGA